MIYLMGIDIGTTGVKTLVLDEKGKVITSATEEYPIYTPKPNWAEQKPDHWWKATVQTIKKTLRKVKPAKIAAIGLSGQMHGSVFLDKDYKVLRPCILWCDQRTAKECYQITKIIGEERLIKLTCNPALTGFTAGKILWVRNNEPEVYEKIHKILLPKDYIRFCLTGQFATEVSDASGTLLFNVRNRKWSDEILNELSISKELLPECFESTIISGKISGSAAKRTGLLEGTPVVGGGGDQAAQSVGSGIVKPGIISTTIGTSGVVFAFAEEVKTDPQGRVHTFCHAVPGKWHVMGVMLQAGGSLRWFRDNFYPGESYDVLMKKAEKIPPGSEGLIFLPYLTGERTPHADPYARGVFFGLTLRHTKTHMLRAVLEGVSYGMRDSLEIIKGMRINVNQIRTSGGGAKSKSWRQIQTDINGVKTLTINATEGAAYGAAILAGAGIKVFHSVESACDEIIKVTGETKPIKQNSDIYDEYYRVYRTLYGNLKDNFKHLSSI